MFGALSADYNVNEDFTLTTTASRYNTQEEEHFDIAAQYNLGEVDANIGSENFGEVQFSQGIGSQLNHARNDLDALITNFQVRGTIKKGEINGILVLNIKKKILKTELENGKLLIL